METRTAPKPIPYPTLHLGRPASVPGPVRRLFLGGKVLEIRR